MFCNKCGKPIPDDAIFCPSCGAKLNYSFQQTSPDETQKTEPVQESVSIALATGKEIDTTGTATSQPVQPVVNQSYTEAPHDPASANANKVWSMWWFKFIVYFQLWVTMLNEAIDVIRCIPTILNADATYGSYAGAMKFYFILAIFGDALLFYLALTAQQKLVKFKKDGPSRYLHMLLINAGLLFVMNVLLSLLLNLSLGTTFESSNAIPMIVSSIILFFINFSYFDHRKHMFIY